MIFRRKVYEKLFYLIDILDKYNGLVIVIYKMEI